ncbi:MAG: hypothetical protein ABSH04_08160 [Acidimicrobiales bacterium]|jgi:hypothetical protein
MFSGMGMNDVDGTEWYFPQRLTVDTGAVDLVPFLERISVHQ